MSPVIDQTNQGYQYATNKRGNLVQDDGFDDDADDRFVYEYDPENRLTNIKCNSLVPA
jgi:hypothetical protein